LVPLGDTHEATAAVDRSGLADIESSEDEDTVYDRSTREGRVVEAGPMFDRVMFSGELVETNN